MIFLRQAPLKAGTEKFIYRQTVILSGLLPTALNITPERVNAHLRRSPFFSPLVSSSFIATQTLGLLLKRRECCLQGLFQKRGQALVMQGIGGCVKRRRILCSEAVGGALVELGGEVHTGGG